MSNFHAIIVFCGRDGRSFGGLFHGITPEMVTAFADVTGDHNPLHTDPDYADPRFGGVIAHGVLLVGYFSALLATKLPGPGSVARLAERAFQIPGLTG